MKDWRVAAAIFRLEQSSNCRWQKTAHSLAQLGTLLEVAMPRSARHRRLVTHRVAALARDACLRLRKSRWNALEDCVLSIGADVTGYDWEKRSQPKNPRIQMNARCSLATHPHTRISCGARIIRWAVKRRGQCM